MKKLTLAFVLTAVALMLSNQAHAQNPYLPPYLWGYSGDVSKSGTLTLQGATTPPVGGWAFCSAPLFGYQIGGSFTWENGCRYGMTYAMRSAEDSTSPDGWPDRIQQTGVEVSLIFQDVIASYVAHEDCSEPGSEPPFEIGQPVVDVNVAGLPC